MQFKTLAIALLGMSVTVESSTLGGRYHAHKAARDALQARQNGFGGFGKGGNQNAANNGNQNAANGGNANAAANAAAANNNNNNGGNANAAAAGGNAASLTLNAKNVQTGSQQDGSKGAADGQAKALTDNANFINFCDGKTLTNGIQQTGGSCNGIVMGDMPAVAKMSSTIITSPLPGKEPAANTDFDVTVQIANMQLGVFSNPDSTYYANPQQLNAQGVVIGHTHITIQDLGNTLTPTKALDASQFAFFKGINDAGDGNGGLKATVTGGLPAGNYRICTMAGSSTHQPVLMPKAQRFVFLEEACITHCAMTNIFNLVVLKTIV